MPYLGPGMGPVWVRLAERRFDREMIFERDFAQYGWLPRISSVRRTVKIHSGLIPADTIT